MLTLLFRLNFAAVFLFLVANNQTSFAIQDAVTETSESHFEVSTGLALTLNGFTTHSTAQLVDENGFEYDTWSLLREPSIVDAAGMSEEQVEDMMRIKTEFKKGMIRRLATSNDSDVEKAKIEQEFRLAESQARELMTPDQLTRFEHAKTQHAVTHYGLGKYLAAHGRNIGIELDESELASISTRATTFKADLADRLSKAIHNANVRLLEQLSTEDRQLLEELLGEEAHSEWRSSVLFPGVKGGVRPKAKKFAKPDFLRSLVLSVNDRKALKVTDEQLAQLKELKAERATADSEEAKAEISRRVQQILTEEQLEQLKRVVVLRETKRSGTVNALCRGLLSREFEFSEDESRTLFETGVEINNSMFDEMRDIKKEVLSDSLSDLNPAMREKIESLLGESMLFGAEHIRPQASVAEETSPRSNVRATLR